MKKIIAMALTVAMTVGIMNVPAYAELTGFKGIGQISVKAASEELTYGDFKYVVENDGVTITKYTGTDSVVTIPNIINGKDVLKIGEKAFYNCSNLKQIKLPSKLKSMGSRVFEGTGITSITIPKTLETGSRVFQGAKNLEEVIIEEGMTKIPAGLMWVDEDNQIQKIKIPSNIESIGASAFENCACLTELEFGENLKYIGRFAFLNCKGLKKISFLNNKDTAFEKRIYGQAFSDCTNLEEVNLSDNISRIDSYAFHKCSKLKQIKLPSRLKVLEERAFEGTGITSITIPKTLEIACVNNVANNGALAGAKELKEIILEEGMEKIPDRLFHFDDENQVRKVQIPATVKEIDPQIFWHFKATIYGYKNSYVETYANKYNIPFISIGTLEVYNLNLQDYNKYQANYLSQNASMQTSTSMIYSEIENSYTPTKYALVNMLSLVWNSKFKYADDSEIWETILIDAMLRKSYDKQASDDFLKESAKMEVKLLKFIDDEQNIKQTEASKKKISDTLKEANVEDVDIMNGMLDAAEITKDFVDKYTKYLELKSIISTDTTAFLKELKTTQNYKEIPAFQRAVDRVVECMDTNGDDMLAKIGQIVLKNKVESKLFTESFNSTMEKLIDVAMPGLSKVVNLTKDPTIYLMDTICGTGNLAEVNIYLYMIDRIDEAAKEAYTNCTAKNIASNGEEKIQAVNGGYRFLIDLSTYGIGISRKWNYYISKNLLSKRISDKLNTVKRPLRDIVSGMLNLNKESTINEEKQYVLKRCSENDKYINAMKNLTAFARVNWYEDTGSDKNGDRALLLFIVKNPDGTTSVTAEVKAKNAKIQYPKVEDKSGYTTPTNWYTNEKCTQTAPANLTVSKNQIFYTEYYAGGEYEVKASEGIKICKIYKAGQSRNASAKSARKIVDKTKCEIPSYIDGYKVTELGKDIFSELPDMTEIYIPPTVKTINKDAFKSLPKETLYRCDKKSYAEDFLHDNKYKNVRVEDNTPKPKTVKVSQIKLTGISNKIAAGKKIKLTATINPKNATKKTLKWTTNNKKIATVDKNGVVTINKKAGGKTVKITAEATDGSKKKATFTIKIMKGVVKKVKISGSKTVKSGKTLKLKAKVTASKGANKSLKWTSSNTKYATVTSSGKVKALKAGKKKTVKITAMAVDGSGKKATFKVKIK